MGLFNLFNKKQVNKGDIRTVPDFLSIDLPILLKNSIVHKRHESEDGFNSVEYECHLPDNILEAFDTIRIRLGWEEKEIKDNAVGAIIVTFLRRTSEVSLGQVANIVNYVAKICKILDDNWTSVDEMRVKSGVWRGRNFMVGNSMVTINLDDIDGLTFSILGYKEFKESFTGA